MHVILMGAQGAGKGTQAERLAPRFQLAHLSTGDVFRAAIRSGTEFGLMAKRFLDRGELVPDDVTLGIVEERLQAIGIPGSGVRGALFDGFPRTEAQAVGLDDVLERRGETIGAVVEVAVPSEKLISRLSGRRVCENGDAVYHIEYNPPRVPGECDRCGGALIQRDDDQPDAIRRRLELYFAQTAPLLAYYDKRGLLTRIDGDQPIDDVTEEIANAIETSVAANRERE